MAEIVLIRHGETAWSASGQHTSVTDLPLTERGERQASDLATTLARRRFTAVYSSPRIRAQRTAQLAGLAVTTLDDDLAEWNYGDYEGRTTADIHTEVPDWDLWTDGAPGGEKPAEVGARLDRVLQRAREQLCDGDVALVAHGHALRVAGARWIGLAASCGGLLKLDTGTLSTLGFEHGRPVITSWNATVTG
ncbi:histidine phosphatase family protein [Actinocatenispora sera]|uniref:Phosphatase n=1 Tax=Actinocatenispora sera TaxID=390989 RepID=A0A810L4L6_9ACTN|nr:histidine phosphatase family protein [Actinocatenispora sera]BCJ30424.1 phosphatase [Actinocatenispora sera]